MKGLFLAVCLIAGLAGPIDRVASAAGILGSLSLWAWGVAGAGVPAGSGSLLKRCLSCSVILASLPLLLKLQDVETRLALLVCITLAVAAWRKPGAGCAAGRAGALFTASVLGWRLLIEGLPWLWIVEVEASRLISRGVGMLTGQRLDLGPSASGVELLVVFSLWLAAAGHAGGASRVRRFLAGAALIVLFMATLPALGRAAPGSPLDPFGLLNQAREHVEPRPDSVARVMFGWSAVLMVALCLLLPPAPERHAASWPPLARRRAAGRVCALVLLLILTVCLAILQAARPARRPGEILLAGRGAFDMNVPAPGRYGAAQAGMFGLLPRYLALDGHRVRRHEDVLDGEALSHASVVIVALPVSGLARNEQDALVSWVRRGGSLVVLGDHTDLLGTMGPINGLTGAWGIELRFDSAFPAVREWAGCLDADRPGLRTATGIGTGASLWIGAGARPLIKGRYGLSDHGDRANAGAGAFLGNYAYDPGEQLGDLVLAAEARVARGRVVVFGDTSPFQNIMLPVSYPFVASLFDDLSRPFVLPAGVLLAAGAAWSLAAAGLGLLALNGSSGAAACLALAALGSAAWGDASAGAAPLDRLPREARVALLDASHLNRFERELWHEDSIGGLVVSLERLGFLPLMVHEAHDALARRLPGAAALPVLIAPRRALSPRETAALAAHIENGGDLLVAAGADEAHGMAGLLSLYGLRIGHLPLGPVPIVADMDRSAWEAQRRLPQFRRANPILSDGAAPARSHYAAFGYDIVVEARSRAGAGRLLLIADPDFLTDRVLENEHGAWEGNLELLESLLNRRGS